MYNGSFPINCTINKFSGQIQYNACHIHMVFRTQLATAR